MPPNSGFSHLQAFNDAREIAKAQGRSSFTFRDKRYVKSKWKNGVVIFKRDTTRSKASSKRSRTRARSRA
jgi:hypothetical protein